MNYRKKNILKISLILLISITLLSSIFLSKVEKIKIPSLINVFDVGGLKINEIQNNKIEKENNLDIQKLISSIKISEPTHDGYNRDDWENPVKKFEGKSIRNYSLSISKNNKSKNNVFEYLDPYTKEIIYDTKLIDYDHIIPLAYVYTQVGETWSNEKKNEYAYNIKNGVNTHRTENRSKGSKGPSDYLPDASQEEYCYSWLLVASEYKIPLRKEDLNVIKEVLSKTSVVDIINLYK